MLERGARRNTRALCYLSNREMLNAALFNNLDGGCNECLGQIAVVVAPALRRCFLALFFPCSLSCEASYHDFVIYVIAVYIVVKLI